MVEAVIFPTVKITDPIVRKKCIDLLLIEKHVENGFLIQVSLYFLIERIKMNVV